MNDMVVRAAEFARKAHAGQTYGNMPYTYHLAKVADTLVKFGVDDPHLLAAAWLHDVMEDADVTFDHLTFAFDFMVASLVDAVSDGQGKNRRERKKAMYEKVRNTPGAVLVKLADRISNVEEGIATRSKLRYMYATEHEHFRQELWHGRTASFSTEETKMWDHLDNLIAGIKESV